MWVSTFAVSALASNFERMGKPFNPLLGETYELKRPDFRIVCEQVSLIERCTKRLVRGCAPLLVTQPTEFPIPSCRGFSDYARCPYTELR